MREGRGEEGRLEELLEVERELNQANKTIQQQVFIFFNFQKSKKLILEKLFLYKNSFHILKVNIEYNFNISKNIAEKTNVDEKQLFCQF